MNPTRERHQLALVWDVYHLVTGLLSQYDEYHRPRRPHVPTGHPARERVDVIHRGAVRAQFHLAPAHDFLVMVSEAMSEVWADLPEHVQQEAEDLVGKIDEELGK